MLLSPSVLALNLVEGLNKDKIKNITSLGNTFYLDYGNYVMAAKLDDKSGQIINKNITYLPTSLPDGFEYGNTFTDANEDNAITHKGKLISIIRGYKTVKKKDIHGDSNKVQQETVSKVFLNHCLNKVCKIITLTGTPTNLHVSSNKRVFVSTYARDISPLDIDLHHQFFIDGESVDKAHYQILFNQDFKVPSYINKNFFADNEITFASDKPLSQSYRGDLSLLYSPLNKPFAFYHNPDSRAFNMISINPDTAKPQLTTLDNKESGFYNTAFFWEQNLYVLHYFYRDPFNKGLLLSQLSDTAEIKKQQVIDSSLSGNIGWEVKAGVNQSGTILLTYLKSESENSRIFWLLDGPKDFNLMSNMLLNYAKVDSNNIQATNIQIKQSTDQSQLPGLSLNQSYLMPYDNIDLSVGTGIQYAFSNFSTEDDAHYEIAEGLVTSVGVQGRIYNFQAGVQYAKDTLYNASGLDKKDQSRLDAFISWPKVFMNYDLALTFQKSTLLTRYQRGEEIDIEYDNKIHQSQFLLLDYERYHRGIFYKTSNHYRRFTGEIFTNDSWQDSAVNDLEADTKIFAFVYGKNDANYTQKFLSEKQDWYFDFDFKIGAALTSAKQNGQLSKKPSDLTGLYLGTSLAFGKIWYYRLSSLSNLGGHVRLSYKLDMEHIRYTDNTVDDATEGSLEYNVANSKYLRHGPLLSLTATF